MRRRSHTIDDLDSCRSPFHLDAMVIWWKKASGIKRESGHSASTTILCRWGWDCDGGWIILHNMIVEDEGDGFAQTIDFEAPEEQVQIMKDQDANQLMKFLQMHQNL